MTEPTDPSMPTSDREATPAEEAFVAGLLADLPRPAMPPAVAARLDAALASVAEVQRSRPAGDPPSADQAAVVPLPRRAPARSRTVLAALAGAAVVVVAASVAGSLGLQGAGTTGGSTAADRASGLAAPATSAEAGFGGPLRVLVSGTAYRAERLVDQVAATLGDAGAAPTARVAAPADRRGTPAESPDRLAGCLTTLTGRPDPGVTVVDLASYEGAPATIVVVADQAPARTIWVVGRDCDADTAALITVRRVTPAAAATLPTAPNPATTPAGTPTTTTSAPAPAAS